MTDIKTEINNQSKICEKIFENIDERFKVSNHRIEDLETEAKEINKIGNVLVELQLLSKMQREDGIKRDAMITEMNENQTKISNALDVLTNKLSNTDINLDKLNKKVESLISDGSIKLTDIGRNIIWGILGTGVGVGVTLVISKIVS